MKNTNSFFALLLAISLFAISCGTDDETAGGSGCNSDFDQEALFVNVADNIIIPGYKSMQTKLVELLAQSNAFVGTPDQNNLDNLRSAYLLAYLDYQNIAPFEFGPAESQTIRANS